jgi:hypothetical protein
MDPEYCFLQHFLFVYKNMCAKFRMDFCQLLPEILSGGGKTGSMLIELRFMDSLYIKKLNSLVER